MVVGKRLLVDVGSGKETVDVDDDGGGWKET
jgi:hypothetical protein